jgi:tripeptidyl-peptidase-1
MMIVDIEQEKKGLLEKTLRQVSDPKGPRYGRYLSQDELQAIMKPSAAGERAVLDWLKDSAIQQDNIKINGNWVRFSATVEQADELMDANFLTYRSTSMDDMAIVRTRTVFLPKSILPYVQLVHPTTQFSRVRNHGSSIDSFQRATVNETAVSCNKATTPKCLRDLYKIEGVIPDENSGFIGVAGFLDEYPSHSDLDVMISKTAPWAKGANYTSYALKSQF